MARKKIELTDQVEDLVEKYAEIKNQDLDFNKFVNTALKYYVINHLSSNEVKEIIKQKDIDTSKYIDGLFKSSYHDFGGF